MGHTELSTVAALVAEAEPDVADVAGTIPAPTYLLLVRLGIERWVADREKETSTVGGLRGTDRQVLAAVLTTIKEGAKRGVFTVARVRHEAVDAFLHAHGEHGSARHILSGWTRPLRTRRTFAVLTEAGTNYYVRVGMRPFSYGAPREVWTLPYVLRRGTRGGAEHVPLLPEPDLAIEVQTFAPGEPPTKRAIRGLVMTGKALVDGDAKATRLLDELAKHYGIVALVRWQATRRRLRRVGRVVVLRRVVRSVAAISDGSLALRGSGGDGAATPEDSTPEPALDARSDRGALVRVADQYVDRREAMRKDRGETKGD